MSTSPEALAGTRRLPGDLAMWLFILAELSVFAILILVFAVAQRLDAEGFRDLDYQRLSDVYAEGMPAFAEMAIFIVRAQHRFDPGTPWNLELLVRRQTGPVASLFTSFALPYQTPEAYLLRPQPSAEELAALEEAKRPLWLRIWYQKSFRIGVLLGALALLATILFLQDALTRRPHLLH